MKYEKTCKYSNHLKHLFILVSEITDCVSVLVFASLACVSVGILSFAIGIKIYTITKELKTKSQL